MAEGDVALVVEGPVARLVLRRSAKRNALTAAMVKRLQTLLDHVEERDVRLVVWSHDGPFFCAGWDVNERSRSDSSSAGLAHLLERMLRSPLPQVAELHGGALGAGLALMAGCDLVITSSTATFAMSEVRLGVVPALVLAPLRHRAPHHVLQSLALTGRRFGAETAQRAGLVHEIAPPSMVSRRTHEVVAALLEAAPGALATTKAMLTSAPDLQADLLAAAELSSEVFRSREAHEGMAAFTEGRMPSWRRAWPLDVGEPSA